MKSEVKKHTKRLGFIIAVTCILAFCLLQLVGAIFDVPAISVFAQVSNADKFETRNKLLLETMAYVGVSSPDEAAKVWAQGVKLRNAAMQYAVMSSELKESYAARLEKTAPNWVTGVSSPFVSGFGITDIKTQGNKSTVTLSFATATSTGPAQTFAAKLTIEPEGDVFRITNIEADKGLSAYTGL